MIRVKYYTRISSTVYTSTDISPYILICVQGKFYDSEVLLRRVLAIQENVLDPDDPDMVEALSYLAGILEKQVYYINSCRGFCCVQHDIVFTILNVIGIGRFSLE